MHEHHFGGGSDGLYTLVQDMASAFDRTRLRVGAFLRHEPLVHFVILAALLFIASAIWSGAGRDVIRIDQKTADFLIKQREDLELRKLSSDERKQIINAYIEDEILYREAYKRGLNVDARMRRNLVLKMRGLAVGAIERPTEADLKAHYEASRKRYWQPATLSFEHVYFKDPSQVPADLLGKLRTGQDPGDLGDFLLGMGHSVPHMSKRRLAGLVGPDAARKILASTDDLWRGPI
ncbi:MAG: hypothetical protein ACR2PG_14950, partial [Hyphomicrobiaceae bacterium]